MQIRLGILGNADSVEIVRSVAAEYPDFICQPYVNREIAELLPLLEAHTKDVDMWLFPGRAAYLIAQKWGKVTQPMFNIPYKGSSLYRTLCEIFLAHHVQITEISFDSIVPADLKRVFVELGVMEEPLYTRPFELGVAEDSGTLYHYNLWQSGKTKVAVTCLMEVKSRLEQLGVPVYRVLPARASVDAVLNLMLRTAELQVVRDAQIAVQMFEVNAFTDTREFYSADELYAAEMQVTQQLLSYAKKVQGSLKTAGSGRFVIFTTRGTLRLLTNDFSSAPILKEFARWGGEAINCGVGIGRSAYEAEFLAAKALLTAKERGKGAWMVFFDDKTVIGPLGAKTQIAYDYVSAELQELSARTSISASSLGKLSSILQKTGYAPLNAHELARHLQILPRSARRILAELERSGLAVNVGEETPGPRGRPRRIYQIHLQGEQKV